MRVSISCPVRSALKKSALRLIKKKVSKKNEPRTSYFSFDRLTFRVFVIVAALGSEQ